MSIWQNLEYIFPEIFLAVGAMGLLLAGVFMRDQKVSLVTRGSIIVLLTMIALVVWSYPDMSIDIFAGAFSADGYATFCKIFIYIGAILGILMSDRFMHREGLVQFEYPVLILLATLGMSLMVMASDLIALYLAVELQSLSLYILAAFNRDSRRSTEAGLKYFVLGALSSGLLLYGASLIYGFTGATGFAQISAAVAQDDKNIGLMFGLVFLVSGLAFKISAAPFHMWTPDVYEGSPTPVTAFFAAAPKFAGMALLVRVMVEAFPAALNQWQSVIVLISVASMAVGAFSALMQTNIKRLMAYSSIGHMGYALIGVAAGGNYGVESVLLYMVIYLLTTLGSFACILAMRLPEGMAENISDLSGLSQTRPGLAFIFTVMMFSLAGIPFLAGFFAKLFIFQAAVQAGLMYLAVFGALASVVSCFYYLNVVRIIWFSEPGEVFERHPGAVVMMTASGAAFLLLIGALIFIGPLRDATGIAANALF